LIVAAATIVFPSSSDPRDLPQIRGSHRSATATSINVPKIAHNGRQMKNSRNVKEERDLK
jgi:hypothetical protein